MANLNKVMLIGRLTRDPEIRTAPSGVRVAKFGFAVNNRKKNQQTGQWEDDPCFIDCTAFGRPDAGRLVDVIEQYLSKGKQTFLEGHLQLERWTGQDGQNRSKHSLIIENIQLLEPRPEGAGGGGTRTSGTTPAPAKPMSTPPPTYEETPEYNETPQFAEHPNDKDIPF
jgi:single-strand DNA-binding protein